jgi:hypothetical protein
MLINTLTHISSRYLNRDAFLGPRPDEWSEFSLVDTLRIKAVMVAAPADSPQPGCLTGIGDVRRPSDILRSLCSFCGQDGT